MRDPVRPDRASRRTAGRPSDETRVLSSGHSRAGPLRRHGRAVSRLGAPGRWPEGCSRSVRPEPPRRGGARHGALDPHHLAELRDRRGPASPRRANGVGDSGRVRPVRRRARRRRRGRSGRRRRDRPPVERGGDPDPDLPAGARDRSRCRRRHPGREPGVRRRQHRDRPDVGDRHRHQHGRRDDRAGRAAEGDRHDPGRVPGVCHHGPGYRCRRPCHQPAGRRRRSGRRLELRRRRDQSGRPARVRPRLVQPLRLRARRRDRGPRRHGPRSTRHRPDPAARRWDPGPTPDRRGWRPRVRRAAAPHHHRGRRYGHRTV